MEEKITIKESCVKYHIVETDCQKVLRMLTEMLTEQGYVDPEYADKVCEREANYPTGLQFEHIAIAIPHGEAGCVKESAIAIGKCESKVLFRKMDDPDEEISVELVVLLAVKNPESHIDVLGNLIAMFSDEETCKQILQADEREICTIFKKNLYAK